MKIGYARVSTQDQSLNLQTDALDKAGCSKTFKDIITGSAIRREGFDAALKYAREGDTIVVWRLDRLGRSLKNLIEVINNLSDRGVGFLSLNESIDTSNPSGKLIFHIFSALAEFEKDLIRDRVKAGLESSRARGIIGGRPKLLSPSQVIMAKELMGANKISISEICKTLSVSKSTLYRNIK